MSRWLHQIRSHLRIILKNQQPSPSPMEKTRYSDSDLRNYYFLLIQMIVAEFLTLMLSTKDAYIKMPGSTLENFTRMPTGRTESQKGKAESALA